MDRYRQIQTQIDQDRHRQISTDIDKYRSVWTDNRQIADIDPDTCRQIPRQVKIDLDGWIGTDLANIDAEYT